MVRRSLRVREYSGSSPLSPTMKPKLILFDFSGTLAYLKQPQPKEFFSLLKNFVPLAKQSSEEDERQLFAQLFGFTKNWVDFSKQFLQNFVRKPDKKTVKILSNFLKGDIVFELYNDVKEVLELPFKKAILTANAKFLIEGLGLEKFAKIFTPRETKFLKPDPRAFLAVLKKIKVRPEEALMVGDELERDIMPAKSLGMKAILIDRENKIKESPVRRIKSLKELKEILI